jgi:hypothetical protein
MSSFPGISRADFLSSPDTSSATQTNSYSLRLRQAWGQAKFDDGWSFIGGQMWSLVTENKAGIAPSDDLGRTNDARPATIDPGYNVGFSFARQYGIRAAKDFNHKVAVAVALENPQATLTTHNNIDNFLLGSIGATNSYNDAITGLLDRRLHRHRAQLVPNLLHHVYRRRHVRLQPVAGFGR